MTSSHTSSSGAQKMCTMSAVSRYTPEISVPSSDVTDKCEIWSQSAQLSLKYGAEQWSENRTL